MPSLGLGINPGSVNAVDPLLACTMKEFEKPWVILVDDDEDDRFLIQTAFRQPGCTCLLQAVSSGHDLFQLLAESVGLPSLLLLDLNMPLMNGFEVLKHLRAHIDYRSIPVIILTTSDGQRDYQLACALGAASFLTKPPTLNQLTKVLAQVKQDWLVDE